MKSRMISGVGGDDVRYSVLMTPLDVVADLLSVSPYSTAH
jgi:hypothetical protein